MHGWLSLTPWHSGLVVGIEGGGAATPCWDGATGIAVRLYGCNG